MKPLVVYESKWLKYINRWPSAITLYPFILFKWTREEVADPRTHIFKHEMWHWYRARKDGFFGLVFLIKYLIEIAKHGYKGNKYEIAARVNSIRPLTEEEIAWRDAPESKVAKAFDWFLTLGFVGIVVLFIYSVLMYFYTNGYMS